jgi:hypothetical protein
MSDPFGPFREHDRDPEQTELRASRRELVSVRDGDFEAAMLRDASGRLWLAERADGHSVGASLLDHDFGCAYSHERSAWVLGGPLPDGAHSADVTGAAGALTASSGGAWVCVLRNHRKGAELTIAFRDQGGTRLFSRRHQLFQVRRMPFGIRDWLLSKLRSLIRPLSR